ncbi:MAG: hypothetical protein HUU46_00765 [Candidatus Hydrogenedentes bacterium]|nr:hypothetical protein [Candidatus Hydrogenedentota bacterium]
MPRHTFDCDHKDGYDYEHDYRHGYGSKQCAKPPEHFVGICGAARCTQRFFAEA